MESIKEFREEIKGMHLEEVTRVTIIALNKVLSKLGLPYERWVERKISGNSPVIIISDEEFMFENLRPFINLLALIPDEIAMPVINTRHVAPPSDYYTLGLCVTYDLEKETLIQGMNRLREFLLQLEKDL